ncbi:DNA-directed RNA polymerases I and III subunit RPAC1-like [Paramacrobiotus metropolitanus]|uniref:DNA-directed RNA polymerases I and III subunit RPAC1-like n=1 Tax=Paramacrobiotus metropolitanus TaxID=2943436 RepID=UPI002446436F|nr:DNA-directed RNA polymerases I and III subunit RPAC1-like [Paramacrobiotus metropolitanus]
MAVMETKSSKSRRRSKSRRLDPSIAELLESFIGNLRMEVQSITEEGMQMEFDLIGTVPSIANAVRRVLLVEIPSMAPETVLLEQNNTAMQDEVLGHRIGLIPFRADPRKFKFRELKSRSDHPDYALIFGLKVTAPKQPLDTDKRFISTKVYSKDFFWIRDSLLHDPSESDEHRRPVHDDILINVLRPNQEMDLKIHVVKGIGKDHIKFSPVSLASYRHLPVIKLKDKTVVDGEDAELLQQCFSKGVIDIVEDRKGRRKAKVINPRLDCGSRNVLRYPEICKNLELGSAKDHFIFSVESIGALPAAVLVKEACRILRERCEYHFLSIGCGQQDADA